MFINKVINFDVHSQKKKNAVLFLNFVYFNIFMDLSFYKNIEINSCLVVYTYVIDL